MLRVVLGAKGFDADAVTLVAARVVAKAAEIIFMFMVCLLNGIIFNSMECM